MFINSESIWIESNLKLVQIMAKMCQKWEGKKLQGFIVDFISSKTGQKEP